MAFSFKHGDRPLDGYTIQRAVGRGGFGEVYYAVSDGGREVALKYLRDNPEIELRGVTQCMNLKNPHLVSIFDVKKSADGEYFVVMEYVSGPSLRDIMLAEPQGLGPAKAAFFAREIAKGLAYLHDRGIVHRDLKPGNIFHDDGYVKIGDYGLSKFISVSRHSAQTSSVGTVHYMAPEVGSGHYSRAIDIYALGVIIHEMLTGRVPFEGSSMGEILMKHLTEVPNVAALPHPFDRVVQKALAKDPVQRYTSVHALMDEIVTAPEVRQSLAGFNPASFSQVAVARARQEPRGSTLVMEPAVRRLPDGPPTARSRAAPAVAPVGRQLAPEAAAGRLRYAGFWIRVVASLIDALIIGGVTAFLAAAFGVHNGNDSLYIPAALIYNGLLIGRWNGQTLGKRALGIKVISADGRPCGEGQAFARAAAEILSMITLGIGYLMIAFSDRKQALHDRIARTLHVYAVDTDAYGGPVQ